MSSKHKRKPTPSTKEKRDLLGLVMKADSVGLTKPESIKARMLFQRYGEVVSTSPKVHSTEESISDQEH